MVPQEQIETARQIAERFIAEWPNAPTDELDDGSPMVGEEPNGLTGILFGTGHGMLVEVLYDDSGDLFEVTYVRKTFEAFSSTLRDKTDLDA